ncbi:hypothetical protein ALC53_01348, partial [Atta colombica]
FERKNSWVFLERIEELKGAILSRAAEILPGRHVNLVQGECRQWETWNDFVTHFKSTFLPQVDAYQLLEDVHAKKQKSGKYVKPSP